MTEDNGAVLVHLVKSYFDPLAMDDRDMPAPQTTADASVPEATA